jgi:hypothetical protein
MASLLPATVSGLIHDRSAVCYKFENAYRSGQKKHKAFRSAVSISKTGDQQWLI